MSGKIMGKVWDLELPHNKLIVLLAMADHAHHDGSHVFPSMDLIAWKTGYSKRQVQRIVKLLEDDGLLVKTERPGATNLYSIDLSAGTLKEPFESQNVTPDKMPIADIGQNVTPDIQMSQVGGHPDVTPTPDIQMSPEPSVETSFKPSVVVLPQSAAATVNGCLNTQTNEEVSKVAQSYERWFGLITAGIRDTLIEWLSIYTADWICEAFEESAKNNVRKLKYAESILKRWSENGKSNRDIEHETYSNKNKLAEGQLRSALETAAMMNEIKNFIDPVDIPPVPPKTNEEAA